MKGTGLRCWLVLLLAGGVAGCAGEASRYSDFDYRLSHPLEAERKAAVLLLAAPDSDGRMPRADADRLHQAVHDYLQAGDGVIALAVASADPADPAPRAHAQALAGQLLEMGVKADELDLWLVVGDPALVPMQSRVEFRRWFARQPTCGDWSDDGGGIGNNAPSPNFGCAMQRNIGAMVANPRDLVAERRMAPREPYRTDDVYDKFRQGNPVYTERLTATTQGQ